MSIWLRRVKFSLRDTDREYTHGPRQQGNVEELPAHLTMVSLSHYAGLDTPPSQSLPYGSVIHGLYIDSMSVDITDVPAMDAIERFAGDHSNLRYLHLGDEIDPAQTAGEIQTSDFAGTDIETTLKALVLAPVLRHVFLDSTDLHLELAQRDKLNTIFTEMLSAARQADQSTATQAVPEVHSASDYEWSALADRWFAEVDRNGDARS